MLARSQLSRLMASRAMRSSSAPRSRSEFIFWQIARIAESFSCSSACGVELMAVFSLPHRVVPVHKVDRMTTAYVFAYLVDTHTWRLSVGNKVGCQAAPLAAGLHLESAGGGFQKVRRPDRWIGGSSVRSDHGSLHRLP